MVTSAAKTVDSYLAALPAERRAVISAVRDVVRKNLPKGYVESMGFGMISYSVPLSRLADTYNKQPLTYVALAAQKNFNSIYLMGVYSDAGRAKRFKEGFAKAGKKLDIGKSCVRFKTLDDLPLDVIGATIAGLPMEDYIALYQRSRLQTKEGQRRAAKTASAKKAPAKSASAKKTSTRKRLS
jgi:Domain of unknown function (DU1801)